MGFLKPAAQCSHLIFQRGKPGRGMRVLGSSLCHYPGHLDGGEREDRDDGNQRGEYARVHGPIRGWSQEKEVLVERYLGSARPGRAGAHVLRSPAQDRHEVPPPAGQNFQVKERVVAKSDSGLSLLGGRLSNEL